LREWELSFRLGMRPWIAVAYSAPVAAASAVFLVYPIGQGSFSDGMPLGRILPLPGCKAGIENRLKGKTLRSFRGFLLRLKATVSGSPLLPPEGDEDNSLLNSENKANGIIIGTLDKVTAVDLNPVPGVYAIRCKKNNKHLIGETSNLKKRNVTGQALSVTINLPEKGIFNQTFPSISAAAKAIGISVQAVSKNIKNGKPGYTQNSPSP